MDLNSASGATSFAGNKPRVLQALNGAAVTFTALTDDQNTGDLVTSIGTGGTLYGSFSLVHVASGQVRCYY